MNETLVYVLALKAFAALGLHSAACGLYVETSDRAAVKHGWFYRYASTISLPLKQILKRIQ